MIEPKMESYKKCATDLAKISKEALICFPGSYYHRGKNAVKITGFTFYAYIFFKEDKVDHVQFLTIGGSRILVNDLQSDNPEVIDCTNHEIVGVE